MWKEIHTIGLREVARIHEDMKSFMAELGYEGSLAEFFVFMRENKRFYYPATDEGRAAYLAEVNRVIDTMRARLPEVFGLLPKSELIVKRPGRRWVIILIYASFTMKCSRTARYPSHCWSGKWMK
jgi:uncharacterized protein (DUF885 family)